MTIIMLIPKELLDKYGDGVLTQTEAEEFASRVRQNGHNADVFRNKHNNWDVMMSAKDTSFLERVHKISVAAGNCGIEGM